MASRKSDTVDNAAKSIKGWKKSTRQQGIRETRVWKTMHLQKFRWVYNCFVRKIQVTLLQLQLQVSGTLPQSPQSHHRLQPEHLPQSRRSHLQTRYRRPHAHHWRRHFGVLTAALSGSRSCRVSVTLKQVNGPPRLLSDSGITCTVVHFQDIWRRIQCSLLRRFSPWHFAMCRN